MIDDLGSGALLPTARSASPTSPCRPSASPRLRHRHVQRRQAGRRSAGRPGRRSGRPHRAHPARSVRPRDAAGQDHAGRARRDPWPLPGRASRGGDPRLADARPAPRRPAGPGRRDRRRAQRHGHQRHPYARHGRRWLTARRDAPVLGPHARRGKGPGRRCSPGCVAETQRWWDASPTAGSCWTCARSRRRETATWPGRSRGRSERPASPRSPGPSDVPVEVGVDSVG